MNLFEILEEYGNGKGGVLSLMSAYITFNDNEVTHSMDHQETQIGTFHLYDYIRFTFIDESEWSFHFRDCDDLGYKLSVMK